MASIVAAACCIVAPGSAEGATHTGTSAQSGPITQLPVAGPVLRPVPGAPIRALPIATPASTSAKVSVPDPAFVGLMDPHAGDNHIRAHAVMLAPPSGSSVIQAAGVSSSFTGLGETNIVPSDSAAAGGPSNVLEQVNNTVAVYSRSGSRVYGPVTLDSWYGKGSDNLFDPHTIRRVSDS
jgi:hypothetical protein